MNFRFRISDFGFVDADGLRALKSDAGRTAEMNAHFGRKTRRVRKSEIRNQKSEIPA